jgi:hypothetical protein
MSEFLASGVFPFDTTEGTGVLDDEMSPVLQSVEKKSHIFPAKAKGTPFVTTSDLIIGEAEEVEIVSEVKSHPLLQRPMHNRAVTCRHLA